MRCTRRDTAHARSMACVGVHAHLDGLRLVLEDAQEDAVAAAARQVRHCQVQRQHGVALQHHGSTMEAGAAAARVVHGCADRMACPAGSAATLCCLGRRARARRAACCAAALLRCWWCAALLLCCGHLVQAQHAPHGADHMWIACGDVAAHVPGACRQAAAWQRSMEVQARHDQTQ